MTSSHSSRSIASAPHSIASICLLLAIAALFVLDFNGYRWLMPVDEGQWLYYADQLLNGRVLYRDVWYQFGPAVLYGLVGSMMVFGKTLATERIYFWLLNVAGLVVLYGFSTTLNKRTGPRLALCLVVLINSLTCRLVMTNPGFLFRQCFNLLPLLMLFRMKSETPRGIKLAFLAGGLSMLSVLISQETGLFSIAACSVFLVVMGRDREKPEFGFKSLFWYAGGLLLGLIVWCAFCLLQGSLTEYFVVGFAEVFIMAGKHQSTAFPGWTMLVGKGAGPAVYYHFCLTYLPILACTATGAWLLARRKWNARLLSLCTYGVCTFTILIGRSDLYHSTFAALPLFLLLAYGFEATSAMSALQAPFRRVGAIGLIVSLSVSVVVANASNLAKLVSSSRFVNATEDGGVIPHLGSALIPGLQREIIRFVMTEVEENSRADQRVFSILHAPHHYFFLDRPTNTRYATPIFANQASAKKELLEDLRTGNYGLIVYERRQFPNIDYDYYFAEILEYVHKNYVVQSEFKKLVVILKLKEGPIPDA